MVKGTAASRLADRRDWDCEGSHLAQEHLGVASETTNLKATIR